MKLLYTEITELGKPKKFVEQTKQGTVTYYNGYFKARSARTGKLEPIRIRGKRKRLTRKQVIEEYNKMKELFNEYGVLYTKDIPKTISSEVITFDTVTNSYLRHFKATVNIESTYERALDIYKAIQPVFGSREIQGITSLELQDYVLLLQSDENDRSKAYSYSEVSARFGFIRKVFRHARQHYGFLMDPCKDISVKKTTTDKQRTAENRKKHWTLEEILKMQDDLESAIREASSEKHISKKHFDIYMQKLVRGAAFQSIIWGALRAGEALALKDSHFGYDEAENAYYLDVGNTLSRTSEGYKVREGTKNDENVRVYLPDEAAKSILALVTEHSKLPDYNPEKFGLLSKYGKSISLTHLDRIIRDCAISAGVTPFSPHKARRSHGSILINNGWTLDEVQERLRHRSSETTREYYIDIYDSTRAKSAKRINKLTK